MQMDSGVRQAHIEVAPALKGDRRVKKHKLAVFRLQQYSQILQVCLCPAVIYLLLPLAVLFLIVEIFDRKFILKFKFSSYLSDEGNAENTSRKQYHFSKLTHVPSSSKKHQTEPRKMQIACRAVMGIQLLLLKAGDVESNPGPKELDIKNLMNELITVAHKWFNIGIQLGIEYHVLKSFEQQHKDDPSRCLSETLHCWLKGNAGKSCVKWETIVEALKSPSVHETGLAEKIFEDNQLQPQAVALSEDHPQSIPTPVQAATVHHSMPPQDPEFLCLVHNYKVKGLSRDHCNELKSRLIYDSNEMIRKFSRFIISVRQSLEERQVPIKHVTEILMGFGTYKSVSCYSKTSALVEDFEHLKAARCIIDVMEIARSYCNFFSYDIIKELVKELGSEEDKKNLSKYIEEFNEYAKRKVYECPTELSPVTETGRAIIYVTLDENYDDCTLSHLRLLHQKLCHILGISNSVIRLCRIEPGSIKLVLSLPKHLLKDIFPLSNVKKILLLALKITELSQCNSHSGPRHSEFNSKLLPTLKVIERLQASEQVTDDDMDDCASTDSGYVPSIGSSLSSLIDLDLDLDPLQKQPETQNVANPLPPGLINSKGQKGIAKYKCPACGEKWKMKNSRGSPKTCEECGKNEIQPYDFIPHTKRMFGDFSCSCGRHWLSGYTWIEWDETENKWVELGQQCRHCSTLVYPSSVWPLQYMGRNASQKPHDRMNCEMCQKYGDCRNLRTQEVDHEEDDWDDSTSVRSEASSISDLSEDQNLSHGTPVNSDEEVTDDFLSSKLKGLTIKQLDTPSK